MLSPTIVWRVEALALPALSLPCARCARIAPFACSERFRVNANGGLLDVWLLYRCARCGQEVHKHRVERRVRPDALAPERLAGYQGDAPELVRRSAFAAANGAAVAYRVLRQPLPRVGLVRVRIEQPERCGVRWDRLLARELGWPRSRVTCAAQRGALRVNGSSSLRGIVADGDVLDAELETALNPPAGTAPPAAARSSPRAPR